MVQRPRRRMHLASRPGDAGAWVTVCDRDVQADAAVTPLEDAAARPDVLADQVCVHCFRLLLMADVVAQITTLRVLAPALREQPTAEPQPIPAPRLAPVTPIRRTA